MLLEGERKLIVAYGRELVRQGLTKGTGGNLSIYNREEGLMAISPSGMDYFKTQAQDIVVMDLEGQVVQGQRKPSSEYELHAIFYREREDLSALVHTHSVFSTVLATLRMDLPPSNYLLALAGGEVRCANYASFATRELAEEAYRAMEDRYAVLLANHGLLAGSSNLERAFNLALQVEHCAEIHYRALALGQPFILSPEEMDKMKEKFQVYGNIRQK